MEISSKALGVRESVEPGTAHTVESHHFEPSDDSSEMDTVSMFSPYGSGETGDNTRSTKKIQVRARHWKMILEVLKTAVLVVVLIAILPVNVGMPAPGIDLQGPTSPTPTILPTPSVIPAQILIPGIPDRFPGPSLWSRNVIITLNLHGTSSADILDQPSAYGNLVETIGYDATLEYLNIYERDADSDVVYWLRVRSIHSGNEGYIRSSMLVANIFDDNDNIAKIVAFNRRGSGWINVFMNEGRIIHAEYNSERALSWSRELEYNND